MYFKSSTPDPEAARTFKPCVDSSLVRGVLARLAAAECTREARGGATVAM